MSPISIQLALELAALAAKLVLEIKSQSGLDNDALLDLAAHNNAEARDKAKKFLESLNA